jgi:hypothetical protein
MATETSARLLAQDDRITSFAELLIIPLTCQSSDEQNFAKKRVDGRTNLVNDNLHQAVTVFINLIYSEGGGNKIFHPPSNLLLLNHPVLKIVF